MAKSLDGAPGLVRGRSPALDAGTWPPQLRLLLIDDSHAAAQTVLQALQRAGIEVTHHRVHTEQDLRAALAQRWDAVICDFELPGLAGLDALGIVRSADSDMPFILVSGAVGEEAAVAAIKAGASDLIGKRSLMQLAPALRRVFNETQARIAQRTWLRELTGANSDSAP